MLTLDGNDGAPDHLRVIFYIHGTCLYVHG